MTVNYFKRHTKPSLAYIYSQGANTSLPAVIFCGGYRSDMTGTKAQFLEEQCKAAGQTYLRFDYSGHGQSEGDFECLTISDWKQDALDITQHLLKDTPIIIVGSSMGGWIALLMALHLQNTPSLRGIIGLAAAPDFTEDMFHTRLNADQQATLLQNGVVYVPNDYSDQPYAFTRAFYEDGKLNLVLQTPQKLPCPVKLIQGRADKDVPWQTALAIQKAFSLPEADITFIEDGDHRLSAPHQLTILWEKVKDLSKTA